MSQTGVTAITDCHVHLASIAEVDHLLEIRQATRVGCMNLLCFVDPRAGDGTSSGLTAKALHPDLFYVFGGLNHGAGGTAGGSPAVPLEEQVRELLSAGCDGIKLLESGPGVRRTLPWPLDGPYYRKFFATAEELGMPLLWHVAEPEEFWDAERAPAWAVKRNWVYNEQDVSKEQLYAEVEHVLGRHPGLRVILAHLYFLSADVPRLARFLEAHPNAGVDLSPGVEMLFNLSVDARQAREFFLAYGDRIYFGTDIFSGLTESQGQVRANMVRRFLETAETFGSPPDGEDILQMEGRIHGLDLPTEALEKIYRTNFEALAGRRPRRVDIALTTDCLRRWGELASSLSGTPAEHTEAGRCRRLLEDLR